MTIYRQSHKEARTLTRHGMRIGDFSKKVGYATYNGFYVFIPRGVLFGWEK